MFPEPEKHRRRAMLLWWFDVVISCGMLLTAKAIADGWFMPPISELLMGWKPLFRALPRLATVFEIPVFVVIFCLLAVGGALKLFVWSCPRLLQTEILDRIFRLNAAVILTGDDSTLGDGVRDATS